ncbi:nuclear transport factor 2 family protein [Roseiconus nitratireducens]|nr:nuclear transport factor 2 family protein [Roseiconus nitratireducens]
MDRASFENRLKRIYDVRCEGDVDAALECFREDAVFRISTANETLLPRTAAAPALLRDVMTQLFEVWDWQEILEWKAVIDGNEAAIRYRLKATFVPNGQQITTEIFDQITLDDDGLVTEFVQFLDTAEVLKVVTTEP